MTRSGRERAIDATGKATLHTFPRLPDRVKRLLLGARTITIDGNTLDTTLQLMLAVSRLSGNEGLILSENVAKARTELNAVAAQFPRVKVDVTATELSIPGPGGDIPAVHYRPPTTTRRCWSTTTAADSSSAASKRTATCVK